MEKITAYLLAVFVWQLITGIVCAPYSCEWGNGVYFFTGIACACIAPALCVFQKQWPINKRVLIALLMLLLSAVLWCAGFLFLDFKIMCKLF